jgi:hypothetical protein
MYTGLPTPGMFFSRCFFCFRYQISPFFLHLSSSHDMHTTFVGMMSRLGAGDEPGTADQAISPGCNKRAVRVPLYAFTIVFHRAFISVWACIGAHNYPVGALALLRDPIF